MRQRRPSLLLLWLTVRSSAYSCTRFPWLSEAGLDYFPLVFCGLCCCSCPSHVRPWLLGSRIPYIWSFLAKRCRTPFPANDVVGSHWPWQVLCRFFRGEASSREVVSACHPVKIELPDVTAFQAVRSCRYLSRRFFVFDGSFYSPLIKQRHFVQKSQTKSNAELAFNLSSVAGRHIVSGSVGLPMRLRLNRRCFVARWTWALYAHVKTSKRAFQSLQCSGMWRRNLEKYARLKRLTCLLVW